MGEVYRATDTNLKRQVAIKILPTSLADDAERLARFQREAEVLALLNHPNIAHIHGLEKSDRTIALVMELVEGPTLAERIAKGAIPIDEALAIAKQIAEALEAAHEHDIIHRDLKPANVKVRDDDGMVKVLDFGLAKAIEKAGGAGNGRTNLPTITTPAITQTGVILGTAAYMSPEQARGKAVDRRTDIWSFGCVLFEMLTGRSPFDVGDSVSDAIASVLTRDPDWSALPASTPPHVRQLLVRCLRKDVKRRLPHIGVARLDLEEESSPFGLAEVARSAAVTRARWVPWAVSVGAIALAGVAALALINSREAAGRVTRFTLPPPANTRFGAISSQRGAGTPAPHFAPSPDGQRIVYVSYQINDVPRLWLRRLDDFDGQPIAGTEDASFPFWSPDSQTVAFFANGQLKRIEISGGAPQTICQAPAGEGGTWNSHGDILFAPADSGGLFKVRATGGVATPLTQLDEARSELGHAWPQFLPGGRHYLYLVRMVQRKRPDQTGPTTLDFAVYAGSLDSAERTLVVEHVPRAQYASGHLLFVRESTLMAQPFDLTTLQLHGEPEIAAGQVAVNMANGRTGFVAADAVLLYRASDLTDATSTLSWFGRDGGRLGSIGGRALYRAIRLSPDDKRLAAHIMSHNSDDPFPPTDLWTFDLTRGGISSRLTFTPDDPEDGVVWSPDGHRVAFAAGAAGGSPTMLMQMGVDKVDRLEMLSQSPETKRPWSWSPDGQYVAYFQIGGDTSGDLWIQPLSGDRKPVPFIRTAFGEGAGMFSPDGKWIAYQSDKATGVPGGGMRLPTRGSADIYIRSFPSGAIDTRISQGGGQYPQWNGDGTELFYIGSDGREVMAVPMKLSPTLEIGTARKLFDAPTRGGLAIGQYSVTSDGSRFLLIEPASPPGLASEQPLSVVVNWSLGLRNRAQ